MQMPDGPTYRESDSASEPTCYAALALYSCGKPDGTEVRTISWIMPPTLKSKRIIRDRSGRNPFRSSLLGVSALGWRFGSLVDNFCSSAGVKQISSAKDL